MTDDAELLRQYAQSGSETAFADLVGRYLPLVYSAALCRVGGDEALAKDVAQTVFIDLARKASSLQGHEVLAGWLYTAARLAAAKAVRGDHRRQRREQIAVAMAEGTTEPESPQDLGDLKLVLDEAMSELGADERNAVLIRYFQGRELKELGVALGISEDAARMRVTRALGKLQVLLKERGVTITTVALGTALATEAVAAVPAGLAASISAAAVAGAAAGSVATLSILKSMTLAKLALGTAGIVLAGVLMVLIFHQHQNASAAFQVSGTIREESFFAKRGIVLHSFLARVEGQAWHIETTVTSENPPQAITTGNNTFYSKRPDIQTASSDGRNVFAVTQTRFVAQPNQNAIPTNYPVGTFATIGTGNVPIGLDDPLLVVWFAFASADYLKTRNSERIVPLMDIAFEDVEASNYLAAGRWQFLPGVPGLPRSIQTSNYFDLSIPGSKDLQKLTFQHTNVSFAVLAWTNSIGCTIPTMIAVDYFFYRMINGTVRAFHDKRLDVVVTSISGPPGKYACPPALPEGSSVSDTRFWFSNPPAYVSVVSTDGWPKDAQLAAEYRRRTSIPHRKREGLGP
jgi:RNA polymerase sigma factor (sigma-70 family)